MLSRLTLGMVIGLVALGISCGIASPNNVPARLSPAEQAFRQDAIDLGSLALIAATPGSERRLRTTAEINEAIYQWKRQLRSDTPTANVQVAPLPNTTSWDSITFDTQAVNGGRILAQQQVTLEFGLDGNDMRITKFTQHK